MGTDLQPDIRNEASNEIRQQYLSAERARRLLDWRPLFTLDDALDATITWYRNFLAPAESAGGELPRPLDARLRLSMTSKRRWTPD